MKFKNRQELDLVQFKSALTFSQCLAVLKDNFEQSIRVIQKEDSVEEACRQLQAIAENVSSLERVIRFGE